MALRGAIAFRGAMTSRIAGALAAALLAAALIPAAALADGDPASDVLLGQNVFYPYAPPTSAAAQKTLNAATAAAKKAGFPVKVALIGAPVDLGVIPDLFGKPQQYADFLDQEISFQSKQTLLVVMAAGYGTQGMNAAATRAAASLPKPTGTTPTALATAAVGAVAKLATAAGHPIKGVPGVGGSGSSSSSPTVIVVVIFALAALGAAAALVAIRRRHAASPG
jgi:MYXO-CTERM domain-containing protein